MLERPFVRFELAEALKHRKKIILLHESDERHQPFDFNTEVPIAPAWIQEVVQNHESLAWRRRGFERDAVIDQLVVRSKLAPPVVAGPEEETASPPMREVSSFAVGMEELAPPPLPKVPAEIPTEVPEVPEAALMRSDLLAVIRERVLAGLQVPTPDAGLAGARNPGTTKGTGSGTPGSAVPTKIVVHGTGGVGKTILLAILLRETPELARAFHRICWIPFGQTPNLPDLQRTLFRQLSGGKELSLPAEERTDKDGALKALRAAAKGQRLRGAPARTCSGWCLPRSSLEDKLYGQIHATSFGFLSSRPF